ncbi:MAG: amidohydrolase family protein [Actinomycetota bacterium]
MAQRCSFCGEDRRGVDRLVLGHGGVAICGDCARLALELSSAPEDSSRDLLLAGIGTLVTNDPRHGGPLGMLHGAAVAVRNGRVTWLGRQRAVPERYRQLPLVECEGRMVAPGFVDAHRHLDSDLASNPSHLADSLSSQIGILVEQGATTVEFRTWGAPDTEIEARMLAAIGAAGRELPADVGAGVVVGADPPPWGRGYRAMLESVLLPAVAGAATYLDVIVGGPLGSDDAVAVLEAGRRRGMRPRVHVGDGDGLEVALEARAVSVDGMWGLESAAEVVAAAGLVMVSIPAVSWIRGRPDPARAMWEAGVAVGLGTGCDGGSVPTIPMAMSVAVHHGGLSPEQALWAATRGGALALEETDRGWISPGAVADLVVLEAEEASHIVASPGRDPVVRVVKDGVAL